MSDRPPFMADFFDAGTLYATGGIVLFVAALWLLWLWVEWYTRDIGP